MQNILQIEQNDPAEDSDMIDSYRRLVINLLKIYQTQEKNKQMDIDPMDCVWRVYCDELNRIAPMEDMAGTVARVNR